MILIKKPSWDSLPWVRHLARGSSRTLPEWGLMENERRFWPGRFMEEEKIINIRPWDRPELWSLLYPQLRSVRSSLTWSHPNYISTYLYTRILQPYHTSTTFESLSEILITSASYLKHLSINLNLNLSINLNNGSWWIQLACWQVRWDSHAPSQMNLATFYQQENGHRNSSTQHKRSQATHGSLPSRHTHEQCLNTAMNLNLRPSAVDVEPAKKWSARRPSRDKRQ